MSVDETWFVDYDARFAAIRTSRLILRFNFLQHSPSFACKLGYLANVKTGKILRSVQHFLPPFLIRYIAMCAFIAFMAQEG